MTDLLPRMNDRKILFMCPHRDWKNCPLLGIQCRRRYESEDVTGWETQPRIVRKLAENRVRCQATLGVKAKSVLCPPKSPSLRKDMKRRSRTLNQSRKIRLKSLYPSATR